MSAVNFDQVAKDPALWASRKAAAARAAKLLGGKKKIGTDIDKDIRGSIWAGHVEEVPGMAGTYFNIGGASRPEDVEFYDLHGNKRGGSAAEIDAIRDIVGKRGLPSGPKPADPAEGGGIGTGGTGILGGIEDILGRGLKGEFSRYGDDTVRRMRGQAFETGQSRLRQQLGSVDQEAAREGISGAAVSALRQGARTATAQDFSSATRDIANQKAIADYEDRRNALQDAMAYVNSTREYELGKARNQNDRDRIESEAKIARERIQNESAMLDRQLAAQAEMQAASARAGAAGQNSSQRFQREMANLRHGWDIEQRNWQMPFNLAQLAL